MRKEKVEINTALRKKDMGRNIIQGRKEHETFYKDIET